MAADPWQSISWQEQRHARVLPWVGRGVRYWRQFGPRRGKTAAPQPHLPPRRRSALECPWLHGRQGRADAAHRSAGGRGHALSQCFRHHVDLLRQPGVDAERAARAPAWHPGFFHAVHRGSLGRDLSRAAAQARLPHRFHRQVRRWQRPRHRGDGEGVRLLARACPARPGSSSTRAIRGTRRPASATRRSSSLAAARRTSRSACP